MPGSGRRSAGCSGARRTSTGVVEERSGIGERKIERPAPEKLSSVHAREDDMKLKVDFARSGLARTKAYLSCSSSVKEMLLSYEDASSASFMVVAR
jgi:hypothetical protein